MRDRKGMIGFCLEASHARGLGHLYKALNLIDGLVRREACVVMVSTGPWTTSLPNPRESSAEMVGVTERLPPVVPGA